MSYREALKQQVGDTALLTVINIYKDSCSSGLQSCSSNNYTENIPSRWMDEIPN